MPDNRLGSLTPLVKAWVNESVGWFTYSQLDTDLDIKSREAKTIRRVAMHDMVKDGLVERAEGKNGVFRKYQTELIEIDWKNASSTNIVPLELPFNLHNYVKIFPKSIIVIAGESNSGKTAFLYNTILINIYNNVLMGGTRGEGGSKGEGGNYPKYNIDLYNSETSAEQMNERFTNFDEYVIPSPPPFKTYERYDNFADVINPDNISVIDYIDFSSEVYLIGQELENIHRKLKRGVAICAIQKKGSYIAKGGQKVNPKLGYGAEMSLKKASLYLSMGHGTLEIVKGKSWADSQINPNGLKWEFQLVKGAKFVNVKRVGGDEVF